MSKAGDFIARWSRLKRDAAQAAGAAPSREEAAADVDPATLPPIESIVADTDIQAFLRASVPAALTRAALRAAWTADPAIRDFIGIADNQWDFNDPDAIPGFGALGANELQQPVLARIFDRLKQAAEAGSGVSDLAAPRAQGASRPSREGVVDDVWLARAGSPEISAGAIADETGPTVRPNFLGSSRRENRRTHGSALPK